MRLQDLIYPAVLLLGAELGLVLWQTNRCTKRYQPGRSGGKKVGHDLTKATGQPTVDPPVIAVHRPPSALVVAHNADYIMPPVNESGTDDLTLTPRPASISQRLTSEYEHCLALQHQVNALRDDNRKLSQHVAQLIEHNQAILCQARATLKRLPDPAAAPLLAGRCFRAITLRKSARRRRPEA